MKGKLLGSLAALPLIAAGVVGGMDSASAASIGVGDQLSITGEVLVESTTIDFYNLDADNNLGNSGQFEITRSSTGFFEANERNVGAIRDLTVSNGATITGITSFLACTSINGCSTDPNNDFTFDITSATRIDDGLGGVKLNIDGLFVSGNSVIGRGQFSTDLTDGINTTTFSTTVRAVPEPTTTAGLLAAGALGAFKAGRRNKKKQEEEVTA